MSKHTRSAAKGRDALLAYTLDPDGFIGEEQVSDLIADLMHLALSLDFDVDVIVRRADMNYNAEIPGQEDDLAQDFDDDQEVPVHATIDDIKQAAADGASPYWFTPNALAFFASIVEPDVYAGRFFITSEQGPGMARAWSIREIDIDGDISTVGDFQAYATLADAQQAASQL